MSAHRRSHVRYRGTSCLNCEVPLDEEDKFCHQCGQLNTTKRLKLRDFVREFFANLFSYDNRLWRTIKDLLWRPGRVSKDYVAGKRQGYANPFRFFFSVSIVCFLVVQWSNRVHQGSSFNEGFNSAFAAESEDTAAAEKELMALEENTFFGQYIADKARESRQRDSIKKVERAAKKDSLIVLADSVYTNKIWYDEFFSRTEVYIKDYVKHQQVPELALKRIGHPLTSSNINTYNKAIDLARIKAQPDTVGRYLLPKMPLYITLITPVLTLLMWLLYCRGRWNYMEHLIFSFHVLTFTLLCLTIITMVDMLAISWLILQELFFFIIGPVYLYKAMRRFYGQSRGKTIIKFLLINFVYFVGFAIGLTMLSLAGFVLA